MFRNSVFVTAMALTVVVVFWGVVDTQGLAGFANAAVNAIFKSRGWFVMLTVSTLFFVCLLLALSTKGAIRLGADDDTPEFSTFSWLTMMFAAGMGVGLLFYGVAEPVLHYEFISKYREENFAASAALFITLFNWGLHAWAIYGLVGLTIAYFGFRKGRPQMLSSPVVAVFGEKGWPAKLGWTMDVLAIYAIAIGLAGSVAMGVFQVKSGVLRILDIPDPGLWLALVIFAVLCVAYFIPLTRELGKGMALLSNAAICITIGLLLFILLGGPTGFLMNTVLESLGVYLSNVVQNGFSTYSFWDEAVQQWYSDWTLNYMAWWLAWAPFVGVFIARISKGRTIREFLVGVLLAPTGFSLFWFGILGSMGFYQSHHGAYDLAQVGQNVDAATFALLETLPLSKVTSLATMMAAMLFIITSVVSATYVLAMFSAKGDQNPPARLKLIWGVILGALGLVMIVTDSVDAVRSIIALSANPFVYLVLLLMVCLLKALKQEKGRSS